MPQRKGGLGRGLDALIQAQTDVTSGVQEIEVEAIEPNPFQPRRDFSDAELDHLASSIHEHGVIQPVVVTRGDDTAPFRIIAGERRWRAAQRAGLQTIPAIVRESTPRTMLEMALIENIQRADLSVIEEATAYRQLIEDFGLSQAEVAQRVGKSRVAVTNALRVLDAPDEIKEAIISGKITEGHARALLGLPLAVEQIAALRIVIARDLSVRQTEELVRERRFEHVTRAKRNSSASQSPLLDHLEDALQRTLGTKVDLHHGRKGGRLVIHYYSEEELDGIYRRILGPDADDL